MGVDAQVLIEVMEKYLTPEQCILVYTRPGDERFHSTTLRNFARGDEREYFIGTFKEFKDFIFQIYGPTN